MKKLLVVDGNSIVNRAFYGVRPLSTRDGRPTNAIYGTVNIINRQLTALSPDYVAVCFADTFHHFETIHHRHVDIRDNHVGMRFLPNFHTFLAILGGNYFVATNNVFQTCLLDVSE